MGTKFRYAVLLMLVLAVSALSVACATQPEAKKAPAAPAAAQDNYPAKNIDIIAPTESGGAMDRVVRAVTTVWKEHLGVNFQTSFYPGASGEVGYKFFLDKPGDGYTIVAANIGPEILMYAMQKPSFKFPEDFVYFATLDADPVVIWVRKDSPFKTIQDLVNEGKKRPIKISTSRYPHPATLAALLLASETGSQVNVIPYGGGAATRTAGLTGEVDAVTTHLSSSLDLASDIRILIMFNDVNHWKKISNDAPTPKEAFGLNMPSLGANRAFGVRRDFVEKYPERYKKLVSSFEKTFKDPRLIDELKKVGMDPAFLSYLDEKGSMELANKMLEISVKYADILKGK